MLHTLRCVHLLLVTFTRLPELARCCKCCTQHSFARAYSPRTLPNHPTCSLQVTMMTHAPWGMFQLLGTLKRSPELVRCCISHACPKALFTHTCGPLVDLIPSKAGPTLHTGSPASTQAAGPPSCITGLAHYCIHAHMQPWETTHLFCSLPMSRNCCDNC